MILGADQPPAAETPDNVAREEFADTTVDSNGTENCFSWHMMVDSG